LDQPNAKFEHLFAVVRFDAPANMENWRDAVSILKVYSQRKEAEAEVARLSSINDRSKCDYEILITRFVS